MLLASCTQDELPGTGTAVGIAPLHIASAGLQAPGMQAVTRAADALTTGSIGVFRSQGTGYAETQDNKQYTYTAAKGWQPSAAADTVYLMANDVDVCAYFPYKSTYTDKTEGQTYCTNCNGTFTLQFSEGTLNGTFWIK